jgi:DNA adenine methylase
MDLIAQRRNENREYQKITGPPRPFIKWVGGKRQLLSQIDQYIPKKYNKYIEPFLGGGALFFYLLQENSILIDNNPDLINCYEIIKEKVELLINSLKKHKNEKEYFYKIREMDRNPEEYRIINNVEKASRTLFLNKTCYNGLYRVNRKNQFNTPFGRYKNPKICDEENLRAVSNILQNTRIYKADFEKVLDFAEKGDFIYFDSPYHPISNTANFTGYTMEEFGEKEQKRLLSVYKKLDERGCQVLLSNSHTPFILDLYKTYQIHVLKAIRAVNSNPLKRGTINEVLISNFS